MKIISGGQIGADIAGLKAGLEMGWEVGGWMPKGFRTKDGPRPEYEELYNMKQTADHNYPRRTFMNVFDSDCTFRFANTFKSRGEVCTMNAIEAYSKPYCDFPIYELPIIDKVIVWLRLLKPEVINVSGNASHAIESTVYDYLLQLFKVWNPPHPVVSV